MTPLIALLLAQAVPGPTAATRVRILAELDSGAALYDAVRQRPDDARRALSDLLERATAPDTGLASANLASAERLARAYVLTWADSFPLRQVARFASWSSTQRRAKVAVDSVRRAGNVALGHLGAPAAIGLWRESVRRATALGDTAGMAAALGNIGAGFYQSSELDSAEVYLTDAERLADLAGDQRTALNALGTLGSVSKDRGELRRAQDRYNRALAIRERIGDVRGQAADRNNLGLIAETLGDWDGARRAYGGALAIARQHELHEPEASALTNLGNLASQEGDHTVAIARYRDALALYRGLGDETDAALVLHNLGLLELRRGDYSRAIVRLSEAQRLYSSTGQLDEGGSVLRDLARARAASGDLAGALVELRRAERLAARAPPAAGIRAGIALTRADLAAEFNDYAEADRQYTLAERLYLRSGDAAGQAEAEQARGQVLLAREDYSRAEAVLTLAVRAQDASGDRRPAALTRLLIGYAQRNRGDTAAARATLFAGFIALRSLGDSVGVAAAIGEMGDLEAQVGAGFAAESLYSLGLASLGGRSAPTVAWRLHSGLADALASRGALAGAAEHLRVAASVVERVSSRLPFVERRAAYLGDKWSVYGRLALVERARGRTGSAFEASERMRARQLLDVLARGRVAPHAGDDSIVAEEQDLRSRIADLTTRLESGGQGGGESGGSIGLRGPDFEGMGSAATQQALARAEQRYTALLLDLRERQPEYASLVSGEVASWREVASRLRPDEALLEYLIGDSTSIVFVVTPDSVAALDLNVSRQVLAKLVDFVRGAVSAAPGVAVARNPWRAPLRRLYDQLIAPIEASGLLESMHRLIIAPHLELHYLPFGALIRRGDRDGFLIERYTVSYAPSASVWVRLSDRPRGRLAEGVLALAPQATTLPGSRAEVEAIRTLYGPHAIVHIGRAATEKTFRAEASQADVIHLATNGVLNKRNPLFSFVELGAGGPDDGRLAVHEVYGLDLSARLVVLSACQTALGSGALEDVPLGDDWVGLVEAFLNAGAMNVLATLWPVEDETTAEVMGRFYREFRAGRPEAEALAEAQRAALRNPRTARPFYWAGFALNGGRE